MNITPFLNPELAIMSLSSSLKIIFISVCLYGRGHSHECITAARRCPLGSLTVPIYFWKACRDERELPSPGQSVSIRTVEGQVSSSSPGLGTNTCLCCSLSQQGHKNANPSLPGAAAPPATQHACPHLITHPGNKPWNWMYTHMCADIHVPVCAHVSCGGIYLWACTWTLKVSPRCHFSRAVSLP